MYLSRKKKTHLNFWLLNIFQFSAVAEELIRMRVMPIQALYEINKSLIQIFFSSGFLCSSQKVTDGLLRSNEIGRAHV